MDASNLEAAFERITIADENDDQHQLTASTTNYHKKNVRCSSCSVFRVYI
jgi:aurora kinase